MLCRDQITRNVLFVQNKGRKLSITEAVFVGGFLQYFFIKIVNYD